MQYSHSKKSAPNRVLVKKTFFRKKISLTCALPTPDPRLHLVQLVQLVQLRMYGCIIFSIRK